jgi:hypothetical protein
VNGLSILGQGGDQNADAGRLGRLLEALSGWDDDGRAACSTGIQK